MFLNLYVQISYFKLHVFYFGNLYVQISYFKLHVFYFGKKRVGNEGLALEPICYPTYLCHMTNHILYHTNKIELWGEAHGLEPLTSSTISKLLNHYTKCDTC